MNKKLNMVLLGILVVASLMVSTASAAHPMMDAPTSNTGVASCEGCHNGVGAKGIVCTDCHVYPTFSLSVTATPTSVPALSSSDVTLTVGKINTVRESGYNGLTSVFSPANGASVSLSGAGVSTSGMTDAAGIVALPVNPANAGTINADATMTGFNSGTTTISVTPVNNAPVANNQAVNTPEGTPVAVTLTASDADGNPLTYAVVITPAHGTLSGTAPALTYTPDAGYNGSDSFTFKANDGTADSNIATVTITVTPVTLPPGNEEDEDDENDGNHDDEEHDGHHDDEEHDEEHDGHHDEQQERDED